jgi:hypothetical protein
VTTVSLISAAEIDAQFVAEGFGNLGCPFHAVNHVVAEANDHLSQGTIRQEGVERDDSFHLNPLDAQFFRNGIHGSGIHTAELALDCLGGIKNAMTASSQTATQLADFPVRRFAHLSPRSVCQEHYGPQEELSTVCRV